jgi:hypothetical protein
MCNQQQLRARLPSSYYTAAVWIPAALATGAAHTPAAACSSTSIGIQQVRQLTLLLSRVVLLQAVLHTVAVLYFTLYSYSKGG